MPDDFRIRLGLQAGFSRSDLDQAFRERSLAAHPDRGGSKRDFQQLRVDYEAAKAALERPLLRPHPGSLHSEYDPTTEWMGRERRAVGTFKIFGCFVVLAATTAMLVTSLGAHWTTFTIAGLSFATGLLGLALFIARCQAGPSSILMAIVVVLSLFVAAAASPENMSVMADENSVLITSLLWRISSALTSGFAILGWLASLTNFRT